MGAADEAGTCHGPAVPVWTLGTPCPRLPKDFREGGLRWSLREKVARTMGCKTELDDAVRTFSPRQSGWLALAVGRKDGSGNPSKIGSTHGRRIVGSPGEGIRGAEAVDSAGGEADRDAGTDGCREDAGCGRDRGGRDP